MSNQTRVHGTPRRTASEFLITVNRLQISLMVCGPLGAAFRAAEDDDLGADLADHPKTLDSGAAAVIGNTGRQILAMVEG